MREVVITVEAKVRYDLVIETDKTDEEIQSIVEHGSMTDIESEFGGSFEENDTNEYPTTGYWDIEEL